MKILIWLVALVFAALCVVCWVAASKITPLLDGYLNLPAFTVLVLYPHGWILFCPLPGLIYAARLSGRQELSRRPTFIFAGAIVLAGVLLVGAFGTACVLPLLPRCMEYSGR